MKTNEGPIQRYVSRPREHRPFSTWVELSENPTANAASTRRPKEMRKP